MSIDRLTELAERGQTVSDSAMRVSSYAEDYRVRGYQFVHLNIDAFPNGTSYFVFDPTGLVGESIQAFTSPIVVDVPSGPLTFTVYEGTDYAGTVDLPFYNPARVGGATAFATIKSSATGTDEGDFLYSFKAGASATPAVVSTQGAGGATDPTSIDKSKKYLVKVENGTGATITANKVYFSWYEVPDAEL